MTASNLKLPKGCFDVEQVRRMFQMMLPKQQVLDDIETRFKLRVSSHFEPCDFTGGDFWGCNPVCDQYIAFYIADCSGHGFTSAINAFRLHSFLEDIEDIYIKLIPYNLISVLNAKMCQVLLPGQFATFFYGVINLDNDTITYASAGAPSPILQNKNGNIKILESSGFPLGVNPDATYSNNKVNFKKSDRLFLYSDAVAETFNKKGVMYGEDKLIKMISENAKNKVPDLISKIVSSQKRYRHGPLHDDLTVSIYQRL